ncbi:MAG: LacI family DNA-binding transcriptional regulator [Actinomycetes bacterium]
MPPARRISMREVARVAGVSVTTVSHVLNKTRPVAADTEAAVVAAAARLGYVGTSAGPVVGSSTIGVAMSAMTNPYFGAVVQAMDRRASRDGFSLLLADTHDDPVAEVRAIGDLVRRRVAGVVLAASPEPSAAIELARGAGVPVVLLDRLLPLELDQVGPENVEATACLVEHLLSVGHRRVAMVGSTPGLRTTEERLQGFRLGMERSGHSPDDDLLCAEDPDDAAAERVVERLLSLSQPPTAVVVGNNQMTISLMRALHRRGVEVPRDLALAVFDDFEWADCFHPRLTAVAQPTSAIGLHAVELLLSRIADPSLPARVTRMKCQFVHRESCGCAG